MSIKFWKRVRRVSKRKAGYETPALLLEGAGKLGRAQGEVRADVADALAEDNGAYVFIEGAVGKRKSVKGEATWRQIAPKYRQAETAGARADGEAARTQHIRQRVGELKERGLPLALQRLDQARTKVEVATAGLMAKPRLLRGYFSTPRPVFLAAGSVVCFDAFVLHGALVMSGLDVVSVWGTTATVAMAIAAANHAFGVLAGAIGLATPTQHRMRVAVVLFVAGFGAMLTAFLLLMVFRADATSATNEALRSIARGRMPSDLSFFISPLWMGPLQVGGSLAAISLTGFWTMAKESREYTELVIAPAAVAQATAARDVATVRGEIAAGEAALESSIVDKHGIEADGLGATADIATALAARDTAYDGEDSLGDAAKGRYRDSYAYQEKLYRNGGLWRMATPSIRAWFTRRWRSRGPADLSGDEPAMPARPFEPPLVAKRGWRPRREVSDPANASDNGGDPTINRGGIR